MTPPPNPEPGPADQRRLVELACQLEDQLERGSQAEGDRLVDSLDQLPAENVAELRRAERALAFLQRARRNLGLMDQPAGQPPAAESARVADDTTRRGHAGDEPSPPDGRPADLPQRWAASKSSRSWARVASRGCFWLAIHN